MKIERKNGKSFFCSDSIPLERRSRREGRENIICFASKRCDFTGRREETRRGKKGVIKYSQSSFRDSLKKGRNIKLERRKKSKKI